MYQKIKIKLCIVFFFMKIPKKMFSEILSSMKSICCLHLQTIDSKKIITNDDVLNNRFIETIF